MVSVLYFGLCCSNLPNNANMNTITQSMLMELADEVLVTIIDCLRYIIISTIMTSHEFLELKFENLSCQLTPFLQ